MWAFAQPEGASLYNPLSVPSRTTERGCTPSAQEDKGCWNHIPAPVWNPVPIHHLKLSGVYFSPGLLLAASFSRHLSGLLCSGKYCVCADRYQSGSFLHKKTICKASWDGMHPIFVMPFMLSPVSLHSTDLSWVVVILLSKVHTVHTQTLFTSKTT